MPASAEVGDLVIWYSGSPQQKFVAYGWVCGTPVKPEGQKVKHYGPVCAVARLPRGSKPRAEVGERSGFMADPDEVVPMAQTVTRNQPAFLRALGFDAAFVNGLGRMSDEMARGLMTVGGAL